MILVYSRQNRRKQKFSWFFHLLTLYIFITMVLFFSFPNHNKVFKVYFPFSSNILVSIVCWDFKSSVPCNTVWWLLFFRFFLKCYLNPCLKPFLEDNQFISSSWLSPYHNHFGITMHPPKSTPSQVPDNQGWLLCSVLSHFSHIWLFAILWTIAYQAPLSIRFFRQEYWSELPFPTPGDLLDPGIEPISLLTPALAGGFFTTSTTWTPANYSN